MTQSKRVKCSVVFEAADGSQADCRVAFPPELLESGDTVRQLEHVQQATGRADIDTLRSVTPFAQPALSDEPVWSAEARETPFGQLDELLADCFHREKRFRVDPIILADEHSPELKRVWFPRSREAAEELFELRFQASRRFAALASKCRRVGSETECDRSLVRSLVRDASALESRFRSWDLDVKPHFAGIDRLAYWVGDEAEPVATSHGWSETVLTNLEPERESVSARLLEIAAEVVGYGNGQTGQVSANRSAAATGDEALTPDDPTPAAGRG